MKRWKTGGGKKNLNQEVQYQTTGVPERIISEHKSKEIMKENF